VGVPFPGSYHDSTDKPPDDRPRLTDKGYLQYPGAVHPTKKPPKRELSPRAKTYNRFVCRSRALDEPVHGRLKKVFPRLTFWGGSNDDPHSLRSVWVFVSMYHNIYISRYPMVLPDRKWSWVLGNGITLRSSDIWRDTKHPAVPFTGPEYHHGTSVLVHSPIFCTFQAA